MIMAGDKKQLANVIVSKIKHKDDAGKTANEEAYKSLAAEPEPQVDEGMLAAAEEVQAAFQGSPETLAKALQNFFYLCQGAPSPEEDFPELE